MSLPYLALLALTELLLPLPDPDPNPDPDPDANANAEEEEAEAEAEEGERVKRTGLPSEKEASRHAVGDSGRGLENRTAPSALSFIQRQAPEEDEEDEDEEEEEEEEPERLLALPLLPLPRERTTDRNAPSAGDAKCVTRSPSSSPGMIVAASSVSQWAGLEEDGAENSQEARLRDCVPAVPDPEPRAATRCRGPIRQAACTSPSPDTPGSTAAAAAALPLFEAEEEAEEEEEEEEDEEEGGSGGAGGSCRPSVKLVWQILPPSEQTKKEDEETDATRARGCEGHLTFDAATCSCLGSATSALSDVATTKTFSVSK